MDHARLRQLVLEDRDLAALAERQDWQAIAEALNAVTTTRRDHIDRDVLQNALMQIPRPGGTSLWFVLRGLARTPTHQAFALADAVVFTVQESLLKNISMDNPAVVSMLSTMESAGLLTAQERAVLVALADVPCSPAEKAGLSRVEPLDVSNAMAVRQ